MLTHLIKSINWVEVVLVFLFLRVIFIGVKNGFIAEFFKSLGVVIAVFVSLHYYSFLSAWMAQKTSFVWEYWEFLTFAILWGGTVFLFKFVREGVSFLFKVETNHEGLDKYASGVVAVGRGLLVCSLTIFLLLLTSNGPITRMTLHSYSFKIAGRAAVNTYSFLYKNLVDKLFVGAHYNAAAAQVLHPQGAASKERK